MEEQINYSIGPLMKAARKFKKFNQSDVANAIGCSQSALSKMEHNLLIPNAPQWFLFSRFTSIPPETIETGVIDRQSKVKLNNDAVSMGYKLPKRYRLNRAQKVREIYPFLIYLEKKVDSEAFKQFTGSVGIDSEFFLDFDNLVNFQMVVDLINLFIRLGHASDAKIKELIEFGQNDLYWDQFGKDWKQLKDSKEILLEFSKEQLSFQGDFSVNVDYIKNNLVVSFVPEPHLYHFLKDVNTDTKNWLATYRKYTLESLVKKTIDGSIEARLVPELSSSPLDNRFEIH